MLPTKVCMFYEISETILLFGLRYLHAELFQFLHKYRSLHVHFVYKFSKVKLLPSSLNDSPRVLNPVEVI